MCYNQLVLVVTWCNTMLFGVTYLLYRWKLRFPSTGTAQASRTDCSRFVCGINTGCSCLTELICCGDTVSAVAYMCTPNLLSFMLKCNSPCFGSVSNAVTVWYCRLRMFHCCGVLFINIPYT